MVDLDATIPARKLSTMSWNLMEDWARTSDRSSASEQVLGSSKCFSDEKRNFRIVWANAQATLKRPTLTFLADQSTKYLANIDKEPISSYHRFDGGDDLGKIALDERRTHKSELRSHPPGTAGSPNVRRHSGSHRSIPATERCADGSRTLR